MYSYLKVRLLTTLSSVKCTWACLSTTDIYWRESILESVVLARVFVEHCVSIENEARLESASLPVVTAFAFHIQEAFNPFLVVLQDIETTKPLLVLSLRKNWKNSLSEKLSWAGCWGWHRNLTILMKLVWEKSSLSSVCIFFLFLLVCYWRCTSNFRGHARPSAAPTGLIEHSMNVPKKVMPLERDLIRVAVEIIVESDLTAVRCLSGALYSSTRASRLSKSLTSANALLIYW